MSTYSTIQRGRIAADVLGSHFTTVYNEAVRDNRIKGTAFKILMICLSHENGYGISTAALRKYMKEKEAAIKAGLRELETYGYLVRTQTRKDDGTLYKSIYEITDMPNGLVIHAAAPYPGQAAEQGAAGEPEPEKPQVQPMGENRPSDKTDKPDSTSNETDMPRSGPIVDFPPAEKPPAENHPPKKNNSKKTKMKKTSEPSSSPLRDEEDPPGAGAREADQGTPPPPVDDGGQAVLEDPAGALADHDQSRSGNGVAEGVAAAWWNGLKTRPKSTAAREQAELVVADMLAGRWEPGRVQSVLRRWARTAERVPSAPVLETWLQAERVAAGWWEAQDSKPLGASAWSSLLGSCKAALEGRQWTADQVAWVLRERALTVPSVPMLEIWLKEAKAKAEGRTRPRGGGGRAPSQRERIAAAEAELKPLLAELEGLLGRPVDTLALRAQAFREGWPDTSEVGVVRTALERERAARGEDRPGGRVIGGEVA